MASLQRLSGLQCDSSRGERVGQFCAMGYEAVEAIDMSLIEKLTLFPGPGEPLEGSELRQDMVSVAV